LEKLIMNPARGTRPILVLTALGAALGVAFAGSAVVPPTVAGEGPRKVCIDPQFATNWRKFDDHTILVESGGVTFRLTTSHCPHLADNLPRISTVVRGGGSICGPHDVDIYVSDPTGPAPCFIDSITPLTKAEAQALERPRH
jgi:hypothetical protein